MYTKNVTYVDFNDVTRTEILDFNFSEAELVEMEFGENDSLSASLERVVAAQDPATIIREFKRLILAAYGTRSEDGRHFVKSPDKAELFKQSGAYNALFMEFATNADSAALFINGVIPKSLREKMIPAPTAQSLRVEIPTTDSEFEAYRNVAKELSLFPPPATT
jgi:hypothetical protein